MRKNKVAGKIQIKVFFRLIWAISDVIMVIRCSVNVKFYNFAKNKLIHINDAVFSLILVHLITQNHLLIQIQYHNHTQIEIQTLSQSHSHPVELIGLEVKLEGQVLCGTLVCNSHSPTPNHDLY